MVNFSRKLVLFMVGLALLLPPSISAFAEPVTRYPSGPYNFYLDWMSPRVAPMETRTFPFLTQGTSDEGSHVVTK